MSSPGEITDDFADRVSADGFADIKRATSAVGRVIWILLVIAAWCFALWQVSKSVIEYLDYEKNTIVELHFDSSSVFPAVTLCNINPVLWSSLQTAYPDDSQYFARATGSNTMFSDYNPEDWNETSTDDYYDGSRDLTGVNPDMTQEQRLQRIFYEIMYSTSKDVRLEYSHKIEDMLLQCTFQDKKCTTRDFTWSLHPIYGVCYTFNAGFVPQGGAKVPVLRSVSMPGPAYGLSLMLYANEDEYIPLMASSTGVRVHVHNQTHIPFPEDSGFTVSPGFSMQLELRKLAVSRLGKPYNEKGCLEKYPSYLEGIGTDLWAPAKYTMHSCAKFCYQYKLEQQCDCIDPRMQYTFGLPPCQINDTKQEMCRQQAEDSFHNGAIGTFCNNACQQGCTETKYEAKSSTSSWPNDYYLDILKTTVGGRNDELDQLFQNADYDSIRKNVLQVQVYFERLNYESITEEESYDAVQLLNDLGGAVGLWIGMSVISFLQFIEFFYEMITFFVKKRRNCSAQVSQSKEKEPLAHVKENDPPYNDVEMQNVSEPPPPSYPQAINIPPSANVNSQPTLSTADSQLVSEVPETNSNETKSNEEKGDATNTNPSDSRSSNSRGKRAPPPRKVQ